jgi:site-specific recombinase XerC
VRSFVGTVGENPVSWTVGAAEDWRNGLRRSMKVRSLNSLVHGLKHASKAWHRRERSREDFAAELDALKVRKTDEDIEGRRLALPLEDAARMLVACANDPDRVQGLRDRAILLLGFRAGVRRRGIAELQCGDLKHDPRLGAEALTINLKGGDRHRFIPDQLLVHGLKTWMSWLIEGAEQRGPVRGPVFWTLHQGRPHRAFIPDDVYTVVSKRSKEALGRHVHPHVMRHTFVSAMVAAGVPSYRIQEITGQKSEAMIRLYTTDLDAARRPAGDALPSFLR